ncbi:MAG: ABC transporter ATP-binding protein/permease [Bacteroidetes bacterium]|nr:ABC transporter ATP-binding protein/permease [Bacteroidota bacterium]MBU1486385.1 ABC transporter ATP-binding protein/permease [Bacteroidota bacterium]MBU2268278.1 ABC transporter ATP-binding protein/permease [Bacteroidota bacterium]MBU2376689.1 ABC transporter ATP-binding protein/permease [Bacteroidota bacterium]
MAAQPSLRSALIKLFQLINLEKREIQNLYIYAILSGIIVLSLPLGIQAIINLLFGVTISTSLVVLIIVVILGVLLSGVLQVKQMRITERIQQRVFARLTFAYAYRIPKLSLPSIDNYYLPELVNRFFDTASLQKGLSKLMIDFPAASIQIFFGLLLLSFYHPVFIVFGIFLVAIVLLIFHLTSPKGFATSIKESDYKYDVAHWLEEISRSIKTFKFYQHTDLHLKNTDKLVDGYLKARNDHFSVLVFQYRIIIAFKVLITAAMLIIGAVLFVNQQINLGQFIASEIIILSIISAIEKLIVSLEVVYDVLTSLEKINKVLDKPQDKDFHSENTLTVNPAGLDIKIRNLNFKFNNEKLILKNLNLHVVAGDKICLRGLEGSGKSTLLKVLTGMWPDFEGNIAFNDIPFVNISQDLFHHQVSVFLDEDELFNGTLIQNITLGENEVNYEELNKICDILGLSDFVFSKKDGYDLPLDPQGKKLSYNIAQKVLLARCLYKKPRLLLMEDGWMGLEPKTKSRIIDLLTDRNNGFTLIAISDDEDFAKKCNKVLMMENGYLSQIN